MTVTLRGAPESASTPALVVLQMHDSLWSGLRVATGIRDGVLSHTDAGLLNTWADDVCDNPGGQRAALARAVASLIAVGGTLRVELETRKFSGDFWEATR